MKRIAITAVAVLITMSAFAADSAEAGNRRGNRRARVSQRSNNGGFFSNLMELERRKNAWLRATFLGR